METWRDVMLHVEIQPPRIERTNGTNLVTKRSYVVTVMHCS
jgi:hypothetical protein